MTLSEMQLGKKFLEEHGFKHVQLSTADGALEAAPAVSKFCAHPLIEIV